MTTFDCRIFAIDDVMAMRCTKLHVPDAQSEADSFIAAKNLVYGMYVVTRNTADEEKMGMILINP